MERTRHAVFNINYHIVWCPKYRKKVLIEPLKEILKSKIQDICKEKEWKVKSLAIEPDHIHLFISTKPTVSPMIIVKTIKGRTGSMGKKYFNYRKRFWSPSYYIGTVGHVSEETVKRYIQRQG